MSLIFIYIYIYICEFNKLNLLFIIQISSEIFALKFFFVKKLAIFI